MQAGKTQTLSIVEKTNSGFYLSDDSGERVFIANLFAETSWEVGQEIDAFIYQEEGLLKATNEKPMLRLVNML